MASVSLELIRDAFKASLLTSESNDGSEDSSDGDSFHDALTDLPTNNDFVNASEYTKAYAEIARIFDHLNAAFAFVGQNLQQSCDLINTVVSKLDNRPVSIEEALEYDEQVNFQYGIVSCVLWLHRPLEFIIALFRGLSETSEDNVQEMAKNCYLNTLGTHHAWPVQQMVGMLLLTLPTKEQMMHTMHYETAAQTSALLKEVAEVAQPVYDRTQKMVERLKLNL